MRQNVFNITLVELIVVIAILAILAGTAAGIGVTLINKNTNKTAQSEVNMLVDDFKTFVTVAVSEEGKEFGTEPWDDADAVIADFKTELESDSKQLGKIDTKIDGTDMPAAKDNNHKKAGEHKFNYVIREETDESFTVTFFCDVKGAIEFGEHDPLIQATYKYSKTIG